MGHKREKPVTKILKHWFHLCPHTLSRNTISEMANFVMNRARSSSSVKSVIGIIRSYAKLATGSDIVSTASNVSLQKARTWDDGVASKFSTTPIKDIFKVHAIFIFSLFRSNFPILFFFFIFCSILYCRTRRLSSLVSQ